MLMFDKQWVAIGALLVGLLAAVPVEGAKRALLIANEAYLHDKPLMRPVADAQLVRASLKELQFRTTLVTDQTRDELIRSVGRFSKEIVTDDEVFVYYAGHGIQLHRDGRTQNYLLPVDFEASSESEAAERGYQLHSLVEELELRSPRVMVMVFDACREERFSRSWTSTRGRAASRGFTGEAKRTGSYIMFPVSEGHLQRDSGRFAQLLAAELIRGAHAHVGDMALKMRRDLPDLSEASGLTERYCLNGCTESVDRPVEADRTHPAERSRPEPMDDEAEDRDPYVLALEGISPLSRTDSSVQAQARVLIDSVLIEECSRLSRYDVQIHLEKFSFTLKKLLLDMMVKRYGASQIRMLEGRVDEDVSLLNKCLDEGDLEQYRRYTEALRSVYSNKSLLFNNYRSFRSALNSKTRSR